MSFQYLLTLLFLLIFMSGCVTKPTTEETAARRDAATLKKVFDAPASFHLTTNSSLEEFVLFSCLQHPKVRVAYNNWLASIERVTIERSLPDPQLTFEADVTGIIEAFMPGLMFEVPGPGKRKFQAAGASAESRARYYEFESSVLEAAFATHQAYYKLYSANERMVVYRDVIALLKNLEQVAIAGNVAGKGGLQDILRIQIDLERALTALANLGDALDALRIQWNAALGFGPREATPSLPARFQFSGFNISADDLLKAALEQNPRLRRMEAEVRQAEAAVHLAHRGRVPDFSAGVMADITANPWMWTPKIGITLPIWKDKIRAGIAAAQFRNRAAQDRFSAEEIKVAVELADRLFTYRETTRNLKLLEDRLSPKARQALDLSRAGYVSGRASFLDVIDSQRTLLEFEISAIEARAMRETAAAELSLLIAAQAPTGAPLLRNIAPLKRSEKSTGKDIPR
ncbi:MAG: TolC family protein [Verrucomicrobia bacterium]|nr:TolC family protein [Verrucomicrobiota bacterium]